MLLRLESFLRYLYGLRRKRPTINEEYYFNAECIPENIYESIFCHLSGADIKNCRLVCKTFEKITSTFMDEKTCILFEDTSGFGRLAFYKRKSKRLLRYLAESEMKFSLWSTMRMRKIDEIHLETLLSEKVTRFANTLQNVTHIELDKCRLTWSTLIRFLSLFKNLEHYSETSNRYYSVPDLSLLCCQAYFDPDERTLRDVFDHRIHAKKIHFTFVEPNWNVLLMMRVLELTCSNLEEFSLSISSDKESFPFERTEFSQYLGLFLLKSIGTLKSLTIRWTALNYHFFFEDFFRVIPVLLTSTKELNLTELCLDFDWIFIGHSGFELDLIPFVRRLRNLKKFTLMKIILQAGLGHLIEELRPPPSKCEFNLGILLSDHPTLDEALMNRELLKTDVFTSSVTAMRIAVDLKTTQNVAQMIPIGQQSCMYLGDDGSFQSHVKYLKTTELMMKHIWNGADSSFVSYNLHGVVDTFPNLTELCIFDGPKFEYVGSFRIRHQWDYMSDAMIMNSDLQLICSQLTKLKAIRIRACLEHLTDLGLTGLKNEKLDTYHCIVTSPAFRPDQNEILPSSVSNLKDLEEFILKGIGDGVTDVTAYFAFNGLKKLHVLGLCGSTKISRPAKEYLKLLLSQDKTIRYEFT